MAGGPCSVFKVHAIYLSFVINFQYLVKGRSALKILRKSEGRGRSIHEEEALYPHLPPR